MKPPRTSSKSPWVPANVTLQQSVTAGSGEARRHKEAEVGSGHSIPLRVEGLRRTLALPSPSLSPAALSWPRDGGLGPHSIVPSMLGAAAVQLAKPSMSCSFAGPRRSVHRPRAATVLWLTPSLGRAARTGLCFAAPSFRSDFPQRLHESPPPAGKPQLTPLNLHIFQI